MTPPPRDPTSYDEVDPFDLPEWLGAQDVTWEAERGLHTGHRVVGCLRGEEQPAVACDLLAVDDAYPEPVADDGLRVRAHQLWRHGEVLLADDAGRLLVVVPGTRFDAESALEAIGRLARAVGARGDAFAVRLRVTPRT